jgi:hypothetical protein
MPRCARISTGGLAYHILNRRVGRLALFDKPADYMAFEKILNEAHERTGIRIATYCLMPNDWHLILGVRIAKWLSLESTLRPRGRPKASWKDSRPFSHPDIRLCGCEPTPIRAHCPHPNPVNLLLAEGFGQIKGVSRYIHLNLARHPRVRSLILLSST